MRRIRTFFLFLVFIVSGLLSTAVNACENDFAKLDAKFEGARMSDCKANKKNFIISIEPENEPINPSPWYAFRVTPKQVGDLKIIVRYKNAKHRYRPKRSQDTQHWTLIDPKRVRERRGGRKVVLRLQMTTEPFVVAAQEMLVSRGYDAWAEQMSEGKELVVKTIGRSVEGRELVALQSFPAVERTKKETVLFVGRQHPPELTGALAMLPFLETVFSDTPIAIAFRERFYIIAVPLMNPDGVANGHWRHNMNGVDLNRDWGPFTQPETQAIKRIVDEISKDENSNLRLMLDFHSTQRNVFYTQTSEAETNPANFTEQWLRGARERLVGYEFERAQRHQSELPTSKNYIYGRFGAPAITYELGDQTDRGTIRTSAQIFAEEMMQTLLASSPE